MKRRLYFPILVLMLMGINGCNVGPKPVQYGTDGCHYCSMTIVDRQHAAQLVTTKGKAFKFDAIECMMHHLQELDQEDVAMFLVTDYDKPGELIDATAAIYLISSGIPSPMGEYLTAFADQKAAQQAQSAHEGELLGWQELLLRFP
ncbi:MAG TPA: nitrous oxide reductase accessory protein NosL [Eudoraea sp.]|nr:nitrous oxide reductase accessory protein NosL [Eudoraea sp.]